MSKGGYRAGSGRKKGSTPWNKGIPMSDESKKKISQSKKGTVAWNKGKKVPSISIKMLGNTNGRGNKGRTMGGIWLKKLSDSKLGKASNAKGRKCSLEQRIKMSVTRRETYAKNNFSYSYNPKDILRRDRKAVRRERLLKNGGCHSRGEWEELKKKHNYTCNGCGRKEPEIKLTRDHIIAVTKNGTDNIENIQPLCVNCNSKKGINSL